MKKRIAAALAMGSLLSVADAAVFDLSLRTLGNRNDTRLLATGQLFVRDDLLQPGEFISWADRTAMWITIEYRDGAFEFDFDSRVDFISEPSNNATANNRDGSDFGILLDENGKPRRFDAPEFFVSSGFFIADTNGAPYSFGDPGIEIWDDDGLNAAYIDEDFAQFPLSFEEGDIVNPSVLPSDVGVTLIANSFRAFRGASGLNGYLVISDAAPEVPLPAAAALFVPGALTLAWFRRRRP